MLAKNFHQLMTDEELANSSDLKTWTSLMFLSHFCNTNGGQAEKCHREHLKYPLCRIECSRSTFYIFR
jgi:hypothetical protein